MALAKKCDRCKKFYDGYYDGTHKAKSEVYNSIILSDTTDDKSNWTKRGYVDLCKECKADFAKRLKEG